MYKSIVICIIYRSQSLADVNAMLREKVVNAEDANATLADDLQKAHETLANKEHDWKEEQEVIT